MLGAVGRVGNGAAQKMLKFPSFIQAAGMAKKYDLIVFDFTTL